MRKIITIIATAAFSLNAFSQGCQTSADLDGVPGKYLTAAEYPWPAVRADYFKKMSTAADKSMAKQTLAQIEKLEQQSRNDFKLTGGNWESYYASEGYGNFNNVKLGQYTLQTSLHEYICLNGKLKRNGEYATALRFYVNKIPTNTLDRFLKNPFGSYMGDKNFDLQYQDWKTRKSTDTDAKLITLLTYFSCSNHSLITALNSGKGYFQDIPEKEVKLNKREFITRYWFIKKKDIPVLIPVSRKEYLQSLLEYYEREQLYFPKLIEAFKAEHNASVTKYADWEAAVNDKIAVVKKTLSEQKDDWLHAPAVINLLEDASKNYKAKLYERTNYKRFWNFYDAVAKSETLYRYNPEYFKPSTKDAANPQLISIVFRYVTIPSSLRMLDNFNRKFDFDALKKMIQ